MAIIAIRLLLSAVRANVSVSLGGPCPPDPLRGFAASTSVEGLSPGRENG